MSRPWYQVFRTEEGDELFLDEEAERQVEREDTNWFGKLRQDGRIRNEVE